MTLTYDATNKNVKKKYQKKIIFFSNHYRVKI
jgi:hypothetical protein